MAYSKRYNRAVGVAQMIVDEGKSERQIAEEYNIHKNTVTNDIKYLLMHASTDAHYILASKAKEILYKRLKENNLIIS